MSTTSTRLSKRDCVALRAELVDLGYGQAESEMRETFARRLYPVSEHLRALDPGVVLVVGPRGSGQTELIKAFFSEDLSSLGSVSPPCRDGNGRLREASGEPGGAGVVGCGASGHAGEARGQYFRGAGRVLSRRSHTFAPTRSARPDSRCRGTWRCTSSARAVVGRVHGGRKEEGVCAQLGFGPPSGRQWQGQPANAGAPDRAGRGQGRSEWVLCVHPD